MKDDFLAIDELRLDVECKRQPQLYFQYAQKLADAQADMSAAKSALELTEAELDKKIRAMPGKYGLEDSGLTEKAISRRIPMLDEYKNAVENLRTAQHKVQVLSAAVTALEHRKRSLTLLVKLFELDYYGEVPKSARARDKLEKESDHELKRRLAGRRRERDEDEDD